MKDTDADSGPLALRFELKVSRTGRRWKAEMADFGISAHGNTQREAVAKVQAEVDAFLSTLQMHPDPRAALEKFLASRGSS